MGLSFVNPSGFKFFIISNAIALLILSMVKSIADIIPDIDVLRFSVINGIGMLLFIGSLDVGRLTTDSKKIWFYNGFTAGASLILLIIYIRLLLLWRYNGGQCTSSPFQ